MIGFSEIAKCQAIKKVGKRYRIFIINPNWNPNVRTCYQFGFDSEQFVPLFFFGRYLKMLTNPSWVAWSWMTSSACWVRLLSLRNKVSPAKLNDLCALTDGKKMFCLIRLCSHRTSFLQPGAAGFAGAAEEAASKGTKVFIVMFISSELWCC